VIAVSGKYDLTKYDLTKYDLTKCGLTIELWAARRDRQVLEKALIRKGITQCCQYRRNLTE